jgi:hypothetical protein
MEVTITPNIYEVCQIFKGFKEKSTGMERRDNG